MVDIGFDPGSDFCQNLLGAGDFRITTLKPFTTGCQTKADVVADLASRVANDPALASQVVLAFCQQPRTWLSIRTGPCRSAPSLRTATQLLTDPHSTGWHGPFMDDAAAWYVHAHRIPHILMVEGAEPQRAFVRWHVVAQVRQDYIALHWNNFTRNDEEHPTSPVQFDYWNRIPGCFETLADETGAAWSHNPPLHDIVLEQIWNRFILDTTHIWKHRRVRAERDGVALNARSGAISELNVSGLQILTTELAKTALRSLGMDGAHVTKVESALLRTLIHQWGTRSYEFSLDNGSERLFRAHCYFGAARRELDVDDDGGDETRAAGGPDSFPHFNCFADYGGSRGALQFLLPYFVSV